MVAVVSAVPLGVVLLMLLGMVVIKRRRDAGAISEAGARKAARLIVLTGSPILLLSAILDL